MARKEGIPVDTLDFDCRVVNREDVTYDYLKQFADNPAVLVKELSFPPSLEKTICMVRSTAWYEFFGTDDVALKQDSFFSKF